MQKRFHIKRNRKRSLLVATLGILVFGGLIIFGVQRYKADEVPPPLDTNLLQNPGFENGINNWSYHTNGSGSSYNIEDGYESQSLKIQPGETTNWQYVTQDLPTNSLVGGYYYELSCKYKTTANHSALLGLYIDNTKLSFSSNSLGDNDWQTLSTKFYLPSTDSDGVEIINRVWRVSAYGIYTGTNHDPVYYDNIALTRIEIPNSSLDWSASPGNDPLHPTTSTSYYLDIKNPTTGAKWYNVFDGSDHWTEQLQGQNNISSNLVGRSQVVLTLSAWSDKPENGGTLLKKYDDALIIYYDFSIKSATFTMTASDHGNGQILLQAVPPQGVSLDKIQYYSWYSYKQAGSNWVMASHNTTTAPELLFSFSGPGVKYIRVFPYVTSVYNPMTGLNPTSTSIVIGIPPESGPALDIKSGFSTTQFISQTPIPGDRRFALMKDSITLFSDGVLDLPLATNDETDTTFPQKIQLDLPVGITPGVGTDSYINISDVSASADSTLEAGYRRYQITNKGSGWSWMNHIIAIFPHFDSDNVIGQDNLHLRARAYDTSKEARTDNWQTVAIKCESIPTIQLPKRLTTSFTWTNPNQFSPNTGIYPEISNFYALYKKLGFNTVPLVDNNRNPDTDPLLLTPGERQTEAWQGLNFGPQLSPLYGGYWGLGYFDALNLNRYNAKYGLSLNDATIDAHIDGLNFNQAFGFSLSAPEIAVEKTKWKNALHFYAQKGTLDLGYNGVFLTRDLTYLSRTLAHIQPEYIFLDIEGFGSYATWRSFVADSLNAQARKQNGETDANLSYRMSDELLSGLSQAITSASSITKAGYYGANASYLTGFQYFPWSLLQKNNFIAQPDVYDVQRNLDGYSQFLRHNREFLPAKAELIPWITTGTSGEMDAEAVFDTVIHTFLNGATGFSVFNYEDIDDMADTLNMTKAIGLISPYEDVVMDGSVAYGDLSDVSNATVSAMKKDGEYLLAVTPKDKIKPVKFKINTGLAKDYTLSDLRHFTTATGSAATFDYSGTLSESTVMRLASTNGSNPPAPTVNATKAFTYKAKTTVSGTKTAQVTKVLVNNTEATVDNNANTWTAEVNLSSGQNTLTIVGQDQNNNFATRQINITRRKIGDVNGDGSINGLDFTLLLFNWGLNPQSQAADLNEDSHVDGSDFTLLLYWWGR